VPLALLARTQRWSLIRTARVSFLASVGHVITSIAIGAIIAAIGLRLFTGLQPVTASVSQSLLAWT